MASKLNSPGDFLTSKPPVRPPDSVKIDLLPPSAFESKGVDDAWKELARATNEVMQLKLENQKLKETHIPEYSSSREPRYREDAVKHSDKKYIDELITKQATEISELKDESRRMKCQYKEEVLSLERQYTLKERQLSQSISELEAELKSEESRYDSQVNKLSLEHQRETEECTQIIQTLRDELSLTKTHYEANIADLEKRLKTREQDLASQKDDLNEKLRSRETMIKDQAKQLNQLKNYIGDTEKISQPTEILRKENETLHNKLKLSEMDRENLRSNLDLVNIRLASMNEVLNLQEVELSKANKEKSDRSKQEGFLLTRWREKVYALVVQQKSSDMVSKKDEQNWKAKVSDLQNELSSNKNQIEMLNHSLSDKKAQLDMEANDKKKLQQELIQAQQMALRLDDQLLQNKDSIDLLCQFSEGVSSKMDANFGVLQTLMSTLKTYGQRISFASSRVQVLQGLVARKDAMSKVMGDKPLKSEDSSKCTPASQSDHSMDSSACIAEELSRVTKERDQLAFQLKHDSETWNERLREATLKCEEENQCLKQTVEELEIELQDRNRKCDGLNEIAETLQTELEEAQEVIEHLKIEIAKSEVSKDHDLEELRKKVENDFAEQTAENDRKLNDAKREFSKAVVSLRQLERQAARDKERAAEQLATSEDYYTRQIATLQEQLKNLEKERNLMMATLRQEGLLGKVKSLRSDPVQMPTEDSPSPRDNLSDKGNIPAQPKKSDIAQEEPIASVLEDLKSLASAVLKDDVSSSDTESEDVL